MADVMDAFFKGHAYARAEQDHEDQSAENKIRMAVLKHQMDGMKIQDQIRARELAKQNLDLMNGQPEADLPKEDFQAGNLPSRSFAGGAPDIAGALSSLMQRNMGTAPQAPQGATMLAPAAQDPATGTHTMQRPAAMQIPGVDDLGVPGVSVRPNSLESQMRAKFMDEYNKPADLAPGAKRVMGGRVIAENPYQLTPDQQADNTRADRGLDATIANYQDQATNRRAMLSVAQQRAAAATARGATTKDATELQQYNQFFKVYDRSHPIPKFGEGAFTDIMNPPPLPPPPPSFDKWRVMTAKERQDTMTDPQTQITDDEFNARNDKPKEGAVKPIEGFAGAEQTYKIVNGVGKWIRTK